MRFWLLVIALELGRFALAHGDQPADSAWPTYLHDYARSGQTPGEVELPLAAQWVYHARGAPQPAWPPPAQQDFWNNKFNLKERVTFDRAFHTVSDGERVYFGSSADDAVRALKLADGRELWTFFTEGPVRLAPSLADGRVYFGSDDGSVYCLAAGDGTLAWKQRIAEADRRIPGNQRMISAAPVRTDVLVADGQVRCGSGLFPPHGTHQAVLDAASGKLIARGDVGFSPQGYLRLAGEQLLVGQGRAPETALAQLARRGAAAAAAAQLAIDEKFSLARIETPSLVFAGGEGEVAAFSKTSGEKRWSEKVEGAAYSLAIAGGRLVVSTDLGKIYCFATAPDEGKAAPATSICSDEPQSPHPSPEARWASAAAAARLLKPPASTKGGV